MGEPKTLLMPLRELNALEGATDAMEHGKFPIHISGCIDTQICHLICGIGKKVPWNVIVSHNEIRARQLVEDYRIYDKEVLYFPARDVIFYSADVHGGIVEQERLRTIQAILTKTAGTIVTTIDAGMEMVQSLQTFQKSCLSIEMGKSYDLAALTERLLAMGYCREEQIDAAGQFAIRGGILDIYSPTEECPYRIEFFDDEVDLIRSFDVESQRSIENVPAITIFPAKEMILTASERKAGIQKITEAAKKQHTVLKKQKKFEAANRVTQMVEQIRETESLCQGETGLEGFLPYFSLETGSFFDYFDRSKTVFYIDDMQRCMEKLEAVWTEFTSSMEGRLESGYILPEQMDIMYPVDSVCGIIEQKSVVYLSLLDTLPKSVTVQEDFHIQVQSSVNYNKHFELLAQDVAKWKKNGYRILILSGSRTRAQRLAESFGDYDISAYYRETMDNVLQPGEVMVSYGVLQKGFVYTALRFAVISENDIFGTKQKVRKKKQKKYSGDSIQSFHDLNVGDFVVHENYGLGIYRGIEKIRVDKVTKDYLKVEYGDGGILYVSVSGLDVLQKYASQGAKTPKLNKLNSVEWKRTKSRVKGAVQEIARELVELYAKRQKEQGYQFSPDNEWQREFEELFPFEETSDQLQAIEDTKRDMESTKIMDRLICGDVGFGKTEVAIRAAFKAVNDGKQVAFLVPTTILAEQHYANFKERMGSFPVNIEMLSRFRTPAQQKKALTLLQKGQVDIIIGTHRLLSKDVKFINLGLLIVDEEQRFGVTHKEKIKHLRENVDVLTLSATPIPRTLHMSLAGIRDMSVLEEAPVDRLPIQTFVLEHNAEIIREAINRELARGGQVYYVYNRVQNIDEVANEISQLVPDANVAYAHGQMSERQLENIMMSFINGEVDVLVSTTIIETGLDISNVNTIIIDNADKLGLSQLYQLRGRVGRSNRTAYAFLMYQRNKMLKEVAEKRLSAIKEFTELGSGIKVAMRDLEIRGAGNLLGAEQSGHMESVGYDLYCKMLNDAVREMKGEEVQKEFETTIDLQITAYIPATYIKSEYQKLDMYKRIAGIENREEYLDMKDELTDRFGEPPLSVENLLQIALLKAAAHAIGIEQVVQKADGIRIYFIQDEKLLYENLTEVMEAYAGKMKYIEAKERPYIRYQYEEPQKATKSGMTSYRVAMLNMKNGVKKQNEKKQEVPQLLKILQEIVEKMRVILPEENRNDEKQKSN